MSARTVAAGHVAIIGAGPGDPELITLRGHALLARADVVLVDRLAPRALLDALAPGIEVIDVGKEPYGHAVPQEKTTGLMIEHARAGRRVARLKGGDPFVFGRGAEEAAGCRAAGVACEIVPGVTSAVAVPAAAGIPVTHRGVTQQVTILSGHAAPGSAECTVDWAALGRDRGTLVLLMAVTHLPAIAEALLRHGRPPGTPASVICDGTTQRQRVVTADLSAIAEAARAAQVGPPAVVVVGDVVALRDLVPAPY